ncbi:serine carboxypeptidase-like 18 [Punica granatum]|uniref:Serine carboxypeptidase-like 18 n=1 Tax=Punica granatum TaxID=22663 RepID=A0A6P8C8L6_PUNGR|nr:serine carboxypeptidase-like 18 [Punica granatum]
MATPGFFLLLLVVFSFLTIPETASSATIVKTLPGYDGELPFSMETGYIGVGETDSVQLFYYFVKSQRSPSLDPLVLWLTGGPGCSTLLAFFYESGPLSFIYDGYNGSLPSIRLNPYTWTKALNIIYVDQPVGTGFSYSKTQEGYANNTDTTSAQLTYQFLRKWLLEHPEYISNQMYVGGDSYSGVTVPLVIQHILDGNMAGQYRRINLKGYVLGNPKTDTFVDDNSRLSFANRLTLIPDELFLTANKSCNGDFVTVQTDNEKCTSALETFETLIKEINLQQVTEPSCAMTSPEPTEATVNWERRRSLREKTRDLLLSHNKDQAFWCRNYRHVLAGIWANDKTVQAALNVREGTMDLWKMCNGSLSYTQEISSVIAYHRNFSLKSELRALIYSGDHDMSIPHIATRGWIQTLNLTLMDSWRAWYHNAQVAGYTEEYELNDYVLDFATVKNGGHIAAEYKQDECAAMIDRWFAYYPL